MAKRRPPTDARALAWEVLVAVERGAFADAEVGRRARGAHLDLRDQALATKLVYGTLAWQGYLDALVSAFGRPPERLDLPVRTLLRLALFQLSKLSRVPDFAAVDTAVELSKGFRGGAASGFVNAVLRGFLRDRDHFAAPPRDRDLAAHLAVTQSHPRWLVERWLGQFGPADTEALLAADNEAAPTVLRANRRTGGRQPLLDAFARAGLAARPSEFSPEGIALESGADPSALPGFTEGRFTVQGEASQLVGLLLGVTPGARILDACAAPGGKATHLAELLDNDGVIVAVDHNARGLGELRRAAQRLGLPCIRPVCGDAADPATTGATPFDAVLLDAPCSGLGTLRQHPEIKWRRSPDDLAARATEQERLLRAVAERVRPGGSLVYATCTIGREENDAVIERFLATRPDFAREDAAPFLPPAARSFVGADGALRTFPHRGGLDGFFAVRLMHRT